LHENTQIHQAAWAIRKVEILLRIAGLSKSYAADAIAADARINVLDSISFDVPQNQFVCVHNGIITNYKDIKQYLTNKGYKFESETDTEVVVKLVKYLYDRHNNDNISFQKLIEMACSQLEGAFALLFKSTHYPGELCATRRGSPMVIGVKCADQLAANHIPVMFSKDIINHQNSKDSRNDIHLSETAATNLRGVFFTSINDY